MHMMLQQLIEIKKGFLNHPNKQERTAKIDGETFKAQKLETVNI